MYSLLPHDIYHQQYYDGLQPEFLTVVLNNAVLKLILEYTSVFAGVQAAPQVPNLVGISVREFLNIKINVLLLLL
jgi:hypothetical protein